MTTITNPHAATHANSAAVLTTVRAYLTDPAHWGIRFDHPFPRAERGARLTLPEAVRQFETPGSNPGEWLALALWEHDPADATRGGTLHQRLDRYNEVAGHAGVLALLDTAIALAEKRQRVPERPEPRAAEILTTAEAAQRLGLSRRRINDLIAAGSLPAQRLGRDYVIRAADLARVAVRPPRGRRWPVRPETPA